MLNNRKLLGFDTLNPFQYNCLVLAKKLTPEVQSKIGITKGGYPAK